MKTTIKKRAFVSAIAMLIVSAIVLTSSTFAWFSMSKAAEIKQMDLTVSSPEGIQISANASAWTASLTVDEIFENDDTVAATRYTAYAGNNNMYPADLIPVSSAFAAADSATGYARFFKASLDDSYKATVVQLTQTKEGQNNAGFIAFDLFFKVAAQTTVYFGESTFTDPADETGKKAALINPALRLAFTPLGNGPVTTDAATATAWATFNRDRTISYEVDSTTRSEDAKAAGFSTGAQTTNYLQDAGGSGSKTVNNVITGSSGTAIKGTALTDQNDATEKAFTLAAGITKMRVYIWVEGQDIDCLNSVAGTALKANLKFTID